MRNIVATILGLLLILFIAFLATLEGSHDKSVPVKHVPEQTQTHRNECIGCLKPMIRPTGGIGVGFDMGGDLVMSPSGKIGFGF